MRNHKEEILRLVTEAVSKRYMESPFSHANEPITSDTLLREDLAFDSLSLIALQIDLEDLFRIRFQATEEDLSAIFYSVGSLSAGIHAHLESGQ